MSSPKQSGVYCGFKPRQRYSIIWWVKEANDYKGLTNSWHVMLNKDNFSPSFFLKMSQFSHNSSFNWARASAAQTTMKTF